jgi:tetratricopeptide (TPR) repeat protein
MKTLYNIIILLILLIPINSSHASTATRDPKVSQAQFEDTYNQAKTYIDQDEYAQASAKLEIIREQAKKVGYINMPDFSISLLELANIKHKQNKPQEAAFLVRWAASLSPNDGRVNIVAATYYNQVGWKQAGEYLLSGIKYFTNHPSSVVAMALNIALLLLVSFTFSLFISCIIIFIANLNEIYNALSKSFSLTSRGFLTPIILLAILILPMLGGIIISLACWSLALSLFYPRCRLFGVFAGVLIISWGQISNTYQTVAHNTNAIKTKVYEQVANKSYSTESEQFLLNQTEINPSDGIAHFSLGRHMLQSEQLDKALTAFNNSYQIAKQEQNKSLLSASLVNISYIHYLRENYELAKIKLLEAEKITPSSFEVLYNLSQVHLVLLEPVTHKAYYARVKKEHASKLQELEQLQRETGAAYWKVAIAKMPWYSLYPSFVSSIDYSSHSTFRGEALMSSLMLYGTSKLIFFTGLGVLLFGFYCMFYSNTVDSSTSTFSGTNQDKRSRIWKILPAGGQIVGHNPLSGTIMLGIFISIVICAFEFPVSLLNVFPVAISIRDVLLALACIILILGALHSTSESRSNNIMGVVYQ